MRTRNLNKLAFVLFLLLIGYSSARAQGCGCTFTIPVMNPGTYTFDGAVKGAKPGDVICIAAGAHERIIFQNLTGHPDNYITIKNCGGQALLGGPNANQAIQFGRSKYFHLTGTGDAGFEYGLKVVESKAGTQGIHVFDLSTDVEIDHVEITKTGFAGIMTKSDPSKDCNNYVYERTNPTMTDIFVMRNLEIHHNYVHDIGGEGIYCGNSFFTGASAYCPTRTQYPHEIRGVNIYDNIFDNCAWESIQVGSAVADVDIHDNKLYNYGAANVYAQNGGIQVGVGTSATVRNNFIKKGFGIAIFVQGIGNCFVYNNTIVNAGTYAILMSLTPTPLMTDIVPKGFVGGVRVMNNTVVTPQALSGDSPIKESVKGPDGNLMYNNLVVGGPSTWLKLRGDTDWKKGNNVYLPNLSDAKFVNAAADDYHLGSGSPAINAGYNLATVLGSDGKSVLTDDSDGKARNAGGAYDLGAFEFNGNQKPTVTVEDNKTLSLPTVITTLTGSAVDPDGSISSLVWTKTAGPSAALTNINLPVLNAAALVPGVYTFRLTATDNGGQTNYKEVNVTVLDPLANQPPVANGGGNRTVVLPTNSTSLSGSASDVDGIVTSYTWTKISGLTANMANTTTPTLTLTSLQQGTHTFRLTVKDDKGATDFRDVQVFVQPAGTNIPPQAYAGADQSVALPTSSINLIGRGFDTDSNVISTYAWTKQSGPSATIVNPTGASTSITGLQEGIYVFRITVTDGAGAQGVDEVTVTVTSTNKPPKANAGSDVTIALPTSATPLAGSGSDDDGSVSSYGWSLVNGPNTPTLANATTATLTASGLIAGTYTFRFTVTDNNGATATDDALVIVQNAVNISPTAISGGDKTLVLPHNNVTLAGSGTDPDGTIATYLWEKVSGPSLTMGATNISSLDLTNLVEGAYQFKLTVTDDKGAQGSSVATVIVFPPETNLAPSVSAGNDVSLTLPANSTTLIATASDPDGTILSRLWEQVDGPTATMSGANSQSLSLTNLIVGIYTFRFSATDDKATSSSDEVTVTVSAVNQAPTVDAVPPVTVVLPTNSVQLHATAHDADGSIASYSWAQIDGAAGPTITGGSTDTPTINNLAAGNYSFRVTVTDNQGATGSTLIVVNVRTATNALPVANAGSDVVLFLPTNAVNLNGNGSDSDGTIASYLWTLVSGGANTLTNANTKTVTVSNLAAGNYTFRLTVTDNQGGASFDDVNVTVNPASSNQSPFANAGPNISVTLPINSTNLIGSGSDPDGTIAAYSWVKLSGPPVTMTNQNLAVLSLQNLTDGIYVFQLTVTDNDGGKGSAQTTVTVLPETVNQSPVVEVTNNITITLPLNSATLVATATDPDGFITSYLWSKQIGPTVTMNNQTTSTLALSDLIEGVYVFRVLVTDDDGATATADIQVTVQAVGSNQPPVADAGADRILFLPNNSITLSGVGSDSDGGVASYVWDKTSGPPATLTNQATTTLSVTGMVAGEYTFRLTVTDNDGLSSSDQVKVTVFPGNVNQSPVANAGSNKTIVLPTTDASLTGSGFDPDGSIVSYSWVQKSGPSVTIDNEDSPTLSVSGLTEGIFQFQLTVTDDKGSTGSDLATITVTAEGAEQPPVADAGFDKIVKLPTTTVDIQGAASDPDGTITTYLWALKTGAGGVTLTGQNTPNLSVANLQVGSYTFTLTVSDNDGLINSDDMRVTVISAGVNSNPVVTAGPDMVVRQPATTTTLSAIATDTDGTIATYKWTKVGGASDVVLGATNGANLQLSSLSLGAYIFRVEVTDNSGALSSDEITVTVAPPGVNTPPLVLAGGPKTVALPISDVTLVGSVSDSDGSIINVEWTQQNGPSNAVMAGQQSATLTLNNLVKGQYTFRLSATDNENATSFSETTVDVKDGVDKPVVFAGNDTTLYLPDNALELQGYAEDSETNITTYTWNQTGGDPVVDIKGDYPEVFISEMIPGTYTFTLTATDDRGNSGTDDIVVTVSEGKSNPIGAAIVFTPNGDLVNDVWVIRNSNMVVGCPVAIFNSLGKKVYSADEYLNDWNGTYEGQVAREGDYYYVFECANNKTYSGALRIVR